MKKHLEQIFALSNLRKMGSREPLYFTMAQDLKVTGIKDDTITYTVTLDFIPRDMTPYIDFQGDNSYLHETRMMEKWYDYADKFVNSRPFIQSLQEQMIKYVNKMFGQRGGFGIYPVDKKYELMDTEYGGSFTVLSKSFKGHFKIANGKFASKEKSLRKEIIRLAHSKPELRKHLLPLLEKKAWEEETEPVFVMQTRGGAYRTVVRIHPTRQTYDATDYTSGRISGEATGYSKKQMLEWLAKKKFYALQYDKRTFKTIVDEIGFDRFYQSKG